MPEKTCSTCQCNQVCDHNKYGFENCGNYISVDLAPRAEVAREIFDEIEKITLDGMIGGRYPTKVINPDKYAELKKKYTED